MGNGYSDVLFRWSASIRNNSEYRDLLNNDPCEIERLHGEWLI